MSKSGTVLTLLKAGFVPVPELLEFTGWQNRTLRAFVSTQNKAGLVKIERKREDGVTSYRIAPEPLKEVA